MLATIEALFLNRRDQFAVAHDRRSRVSVISIDSQDKHEWIWLTDGKSARWNRVEVGDFERLLNNPMFDKHSCQLA